MKLFKVLLLAPLIISLVFSCSSDNDEIITSSDLKSQPLMKSSSFKDKSVTIPFKAHFYTKRDYSNEGVGYCSEDPFLAFNYQVGEGEATHLGRFTTTMQFCGNGFDYKNGEGVFVAANGDELYIAVPSVGFIGHILPYAHPLYELQFQDPFIFTGGTGRFEGASGEGMTNSFVDLFDDEGNFIPEHQTDHQFMGTLILPKH